MSRVWRTLRSYLLWTHQRGSFHYDVMVTLILLFIFLTPRYVDFKDKPVQRIPHPIGVIVNPDGQGGLIYQIDAKALKPGSDVSAQLQKIIEPISGEIRLVDYKAYSDARGNLKYYEVRARRP